MFDKILIGAWILLGSILVIENMVIWQMWYLFLTQGINVWIIILIALLIGVSLWYWVRWILNNKSNEDESDEYDF